MSIYSQENMKTTIVRATYHNNTRSEFQLPNKVCLSNIRMINVGCAVPDSAIANGCRYPMASGVGGLIQNIFLYANDNQVVSQLRNANKYLAYHNSRRGNDEEYALVSELSQSALGFSQDLDHKINFTANKPLTADVNTTPKGWLLVSDCLGFLQATTAVPSDVCNMRIVIEWSSSDLLNFAVDDVTVATNSMTIAEPQLIVDVVEGAKSGNVQVSYWDIEDDRAVIPSVATGVKATTDFRLDGFTNKFVDKVLFVNNTRTQNKYTGMDKSVPQPEENLEITLNGRVAVPFGGINTAKKQKMLNESWGQNNFPVGENLEGMVGAANLYENATGSFSYGGMRWGKRVNELQMTYSRVGGAAAPQKDEFDYRIFAEVAKTFKLDKGRVLIANN